MNIVRNWRQILAVIRQAGYERAVLQIGETWNCIEEMGDEIERLEMELNALKMQRCETCRHRIDEEGSEVYCEKMLPESDWIGDDWRCAYWQAKEDAK